MALGEQRGDLSFSVSRGGGRQHSRLRRVNINGILVAALIDIG